MNIETNKNIFAYINTYSVVLFFIGVFLLFSYIYILNKTPPTFIAYITITSVGIFFVSVLLDSFLNIKNVDLDYFKNIMVGISGGLAVWIFSSVELNLENWNWLTLNEFLIKIAFGIMIILIGYSLVRKKKIKRRSP